MLLPERLKGLFGVGRGLREKMDTTLQVFLPFFGMYSHLSEFAPKSVTFLVNGVELAADLFELVLERRECALPARYGRGERGRPVR